MGNPFSKRNFDPPKISIGYDQFRSSLSEQQRVLFDQFQREQSEYDKWEQTKEKSSEHNAAAIGPALIVSAYHIADYVNRFDPSIIRGLIELAVSLLVFYFIFYIAFEALKPNGADGTDIWKYFVVFAAASFIACKIL